MASVKALRDGEEQGLECLGELRAVKGALAKELLIQKPVTIPGAGSYLKDFTAPLYGRGVMAELAKGEKGCGPCVGVLAKDKNPPKGYVRRQMGPHLLCVPVYDQRLFSSLAWKVLGYLPAGEGYLKVAKRRVGFWVGLAVLALLVFAVSYLGFRHGPQALWNTLLELPETLSDGWYWLLRKWGVV